MKGRTEEKGGREMNKKAGVRGGGGEEVREREREN